MLLPVRRSGRRRSSSWPASQKCWPASRPRIKQIYFFVVLLPSTEADAATAHEEAGGGESAAGGSGSGSGSGGKGGDSGGSGSGQGKGGGVGPAPTTGAGRSRRIRAMKNQPEKYREYQLRKRLARLLKRSKVDYL